MRDGNKRGGILLAKQQEQHFRDPIRCRSIWVLRCLCRAMSSWIYRSAGFVHAWVSSAFARWRSCGYRVGRVIEWVRCRSSHALAPSRRMGHSAIPECSDPCRRCYCVVCVSCCWRRCVLLVCGKRLPGHLGDFREEKVPVGTGSLLWLCWYQRLLHVGGDIVLSGSEVLVRSISGAACTDISGFLTALETPSR